MTTMTDAGLRVAREHLGLTAEALARILGVHERTVRRWEMGEAAVPDGITEDIVALRVEAAEDVEEAVVELDRPDPVLVIPNSGTLRAGRPASWWRAVAGRAVEQVPGAVIRYDDGTEGS